jgi:hypothetical protein
MWRILSCMFVAIKFWIPCKICCCGGNSICHLAYDGTPGKMAYAYLTFNVQGPLPLGSWLMAVEKVILSFFYEGNFIDLKRLLQGDKKLLGSFMASAELRCTQAIKNGR